MDNEIWKAKLAAMRYLVSRCQFQDGNQAALTYSNAELTALLRVVNVEECSERP